MEDEELFLLWCCWSSSWKACSACLNPFFFKYATTNFSNWSSSISLSLSRSLWVKHWFNLGIVVFPVRAPGSTTEQVGLLCSGQKRRVLYVELTFFLFWDAPFTQKHSDGPVGDWTKSHFCGPYREFQISDPIGTQWTWSGI